MLKMLRFAVLAWILVLSPLPLYAQQLESRSTAFAAERHLIEATLETVVAVLQETTLQNEPTGLSARMRHITDELSRAVRLAGARPEGRGALSQQELEQLRVLLYDAVEELRRLREELEEDAAYDVAARLEPVEQNLREAVYLVVDAAPVPSQDRRARSLDPEPPARLNTSFVAVKAPKPDARPRVSSSSPSSACMPEDCRRKGRDWWYPGAVVGEYAYDWPFRTGTGVYRFIPAVRYNRVEGLVLSIGDRPMEWSDYERLDGYGQVGYAFALEDIRYQIGVETRLDPGRSDDFGVKLGATYYHNTATNDDWKTTWLENSLAAFFFEHDFFDYYDVEGWTIYAVQRLTPYAQLSAGYRQDTYESLEINTSWSLFAGGEFEPNPVVAEGDMSSVLAALDGGRVEDLYHLPRGAAFRVEAEFGDGLGGDFAFRRYVADGRAYLPVTPFSSLALRLRGGVVEGDVIPIQKAFTLGGIGSVRGYPQNAFLGTRMALFNAEYIIGEASLFDDFLDDIQFIGFFDAGWVNTFDTDRLHLDDVVHSAGIGLGLDDRAVRLELAFPLRDLEGLDQDPTLWLRIAPTF